MRSRSGFSLVEVIIASSVLVIALFGIMAAAFQSYRKSDVGDEYQTASLLCAERLDYFRSQRDPYRAVGGTWYESPADPKRQVDFNNDSRVHVIANETPMLFVREYCVATSENRYKAGATDLGQGAQGQRNTTTVANRVNWIPDTPDIVPGTSNPVDGVMPNSDCLDAVVPLVQVGPLSTIVGPAVPGIPTDKTFNFIRAPRCNEVLNLGGSFTMRKSGGGQVEGVPAAVRYIREVWVQTNHPLGRGYSDPSAAGAFRSGVDDRYPGAVQPTPGFYGLASAAQGTGGTYADIPKNVIARAAGSGSAASGATQSRIPPYVVAVTVRVFLRDPTVRSLVPSGNSVGGATDSGGFKAGMGYDPARPLATMSGYFGLRRYLQ